MINHNLQSGYTIPTATNYYKHEFIININPFMNPFIKPCFNRESSTREDQDEVRKQLVGIARKTELADGNSDMCHWQILASQVHPVRYEVIVAVVYIAVIVAVIVTMYHNVSQLCHDDF